jgi:hypothetical protein
MASLAGSDLSSPEVCKDTYSFPGWYALLKSHCQLRNCWDQVNPDQAENPEPTAPSILPMAEWVVGYEKTLRQIHQARQEDYNARLENDELENGEHRPIYQAPSQDELEKAYDREIKRQLVQAPNNALKAADIQKIWEWIQKTVSSDVLSTHMVGLVDSGTFTIREIVRAIKADLSPSKSSEVTVIRANYRSHLKKARKTGIKPHLWYRDFYKIFMQARAQNIPDINGFIGIDDFLQAVSTRIAPGWAQTKRQQIIEQDTLGKPLPSLEEISKTLGALLYASELLDVSGGAPIFATLAGAATGDQTLPENPKPDASQNSTTTKKTYECPCRKGNSFKHHTWEPLNCRALRYAYTGVKDPLLKRDLTESDLQAIRDRLRGNKFKNVLKQLEKEEGRLKEPNQTSSQVTQGSNSPYPGTLTS